MRAGDLRHRITIQQKNTSKDTYGEEAEAPYSNMATVWGAVEPLQGREFLQAKQLQAEVTTRIRIRYRSGIQPEMRVAWSGHTYDILSVIEPESRKRELQLMCREIL